MSVPIEDTNFALMRWYGFEPLVEADPARAMAIAMETDHPWLSESIARRAIAADALPAAMNALLSKEAHPEPVRAVLSGLLEALPSRAEMPEGWSELYPNLKSHSKPEIRRQAFELAQRFGDPLAEKEMVSRVLDQSIPADERIDFFRMLVSARSPMIAPEIPGLEQDAVLSAEAIRAEGVFPESGSAKRLLALLAQEDNPESEHAIAILETLASRKNFADSLVEAVLSGAVDKKIIPAYLARQITMTSSKGDAFARNLGIDGGDARKKAKLLADWKKKLSDSYLAHADPVEGREVFRRTCFACHRLYGEGGILGPDLTGSGRADLDYFLINVLFPSEDVAPDFRLVTLKLKDGRTLTGNIVEENKNVITFRQVGQTDRIDSSEIVERTVSEISLMPPGLIDTMKREDVRDLVGYLRTSKPLP